MAVVLFFIFSKSIDRYCAIQSVEPWRVPVLGPRTVIFAHTRVENLRQEGGVGVVSRWMCYSWVDDSPIGNSGPEQQYRQRAEHHSVAENGVHSQYIDARNPAAALILCTLQDRCRLLSLFRQLRHLFRNCDAPEFDTAKSAHWSSREALRMVGKFLRRRIPCMSAAHGML